LEEDEVVPSDLLLLSAVSSNGNSVQKCEITTANLDGEPNMKVRALPIPSNFNCFLKFGLYPF